MRQLPLTQGKTAQLSDEDYDSIAQYKWCARFSKATGTYYALRSVHVRVDGKRKTQIVLMHRQILGLVRGDGLRGDHKNHDTLDNQRENLRLASGLQNGSNQVKPKHNTTGYKGVIWHKPAKKFCARVGVNYKKVIIGYYATPEQAALAYNEAALKYHGEFAHLNEIR